MDKEEIQRIIKAGETHAIEFKESLSLLDEIGEAISAFSNTNGGTIFVGVKSNKEVIGVQIGKKTIEDLANYIKTHTDNHVFPKISVADVQGKSVIIIEVKESDEKPVFFKKHAYIRVGNSRHELSASEIRKLAKESGKKTYWDEQICKEASINDIDEEKVKWFLRKAKYERNFDIDENTPIGEALKRLELLKNGKLTNATILLFGKNPQRFFLLAETKCARFKGTEPLEFIDMKVFRGNIFDQRDNAVEFVKEHIRLHAKIVEIERKETWEYPIESVREAITNAICHRDYDVPSNVQVRIFDDRLEVWGCGLLPKPLTPEDLKKEHSSVLRNPSIAECFFLVKYVEEWGTGTNRIIEWSVKNGLPEPLFEEIAGNFVVTLRKYRVTDEVIKELNERQKKAVDFLKTNGKITLSEYMALLEDITEKKAYRDIKDMELKKIIKAVGEKKGRYYVLA